MVSLAIVMESRYMELVKEAKNSGYVVGLENGLMTTPDMAKIELGIMVRS